MKLLNQPLVSIITLNMNGRKYLEVCLPSIRKQSYPNIETIVVDNGSTDDSADFISKNFPEVKLIKNSKNLGFGGGNNIGIKTARGNYIFILNNDTELDINCVAELYKGINKSPKVGMCATKILSYFDRQMIDNIGHLLYYDGLNRGKGRLEPDKGQYNKIAEAFYPSGCAAFYRKEAIDEAGPFDEDFFLYGDDTELGLRCRFLDWQCLYIPTAIVYHMYSATAGKYTPLKAKLVERNRIWVAVKLFPFPLLLLNPFFALIRYIYQAYGALCGKGAAGKFTEEFSKAQLIKILLIANLEALLGIPRMIKKRKIIQKTKKINNKQFYQWLNKFGISIKELALKE